MHRLGLDVGGTFTDIVSLDQATGAMGWWKVPTDPDTPSRGVLGALAATGVEFAEVEAVRLGTTLGVNALLTGSGAKTGLITTDGFTDILEIRRTHRQSLFDLDERLPEPIVPRHLRLGVSERVDAEGEVIRPLDEDGVRRAWRTLRDAGVTAVAIAFLFSFENPDHERRAREILHEEGAAGEIFISSDVLPAYREYERTSTTVVAARIASTVETYLQQLGRDLESLGIESRRLSITTNSGGALSSATVARLPISTLLSGPVGGVEAARRLAAEHGWHDVLTLDMGGTSCDVSGIVDGVPDERLDMVVGGHTIAYPTYDIETIGAGGGSIAWIDAGGALRVGPQSAGSAPGPACYGRGGTAPTVTDANLVLGRYAPDAPLAGSVALDIDAARKAIAMNVADPLGLNVEAAAAGILRIVNVLMTNAVRTISVERGRDLRDFTLVAFGGAGPAHAGEIARELSIPRVLIPPFPGCASAFGALVARSRRDFVRTVGRRTDRLDATDVTGLVDEMIAAACHALNEEGVPPVEQTVQTWLDLRYVGQAHELGVLSSSDRVERPAIVDAEASFHALHRRLYGHSFDDVPVELVHVRVKGLGPQPQTEMTWSWPETAGIELASQRAVYFDELDGYVDTEIRVREQIQPGDRIVGPSIVHQIDSTVVVPYGFVAEARPGGSLVLTLAQAVRKVGRDGAQVVHEQVAQR